MCVWLFLSSCSLHNSVQCLWLLFLLLNELHTFLDQAVPIHIEPKQGPINWSAEFNVKYLLIHLPREYSIPTKNMYGKTILNDRIEITGQATFSRINVKFKFLIPA